MTIVLRTGFRRDVQPELRLAVDLKTSVIQEVQSGLVSLVSIVALLKYRKLCIRDAKSFIGGGRQIMPPPITVLVILELLTWI